MLNKAQQSNPVSKNYQDYDNAYGAEYPGEDYPVETYGYEYMVPEDEFVMADEPQASRPLNIDQVRDEIRRLLQLAEQKGADSKVLDAIRDIAGQVNLSASLPGDRQAQALGQAMADLSNLEIEILTERAEGPTEEEADKDKTKEIEAKIQELLAKIEDPELFKYAMERDDLREMLEKAKASLDLGDLDAAEMAVMEAESTIQSKEAEHKSTAYQDLIDLESDIKSVKDYLQTNLVDKFKYGQSTLDELDDIAARLRDGSLTAEAAEAEAKKAVKDLENSILAHFKKIPGAVKTQLETLFSGYWEKATAVE
ncbi:MAG: hypothetical protein IT572_09550 [Deltaproteobacteria bacterium]|nr:hypothetical protein [Deltaproteobacteria bacterium]